MEHSHKDLPSRSRDLEVNFIENELPHYHSYYADSSVRFDANTGAYTNVEPPGVADPPLPPATTEPDGSITVVTSPLQSKEEALKAMKYWDMIFPSAMEELERSKPTERRSSQASEYGIRGCKSWLNVYRKLEAAQLYYDEVRAVKGILRKTVRWGADNLVQPVHLASELVPDVKIVSPVLAAVQVVLQAAKKNCEVQKELAEAIENLDERFSDIESFLAFLYEDERVLKKSVALVTSVLRAIERGIRFFRKSSGVTARSGACGRL